MVAVAASDVQTWLAREERGVTRDEMTYDEAAGGDERGREAY